MSRTLSNLDAYALILGRLLQHALRGISGVDQTSLLWRRLTKSASCLKGL